MGRRDAVRQALWNDDYIRGDDSADATIVLRREHAVAIRMQCRDFVKLEQPERMHFVVEQASPRPRAG